MPTVSDARASGGSFQAVCARDVVDALDEEVHTAGYGVVRIRIRELDLLHAVGVKVAAVNTDQ